jgi:hypothetical protein
MDVAAVERSFGELLAAFGDLVVARTQGAPADALVGSTASLARRYRARRRDFDGVLEGVGARETGDDGRAVANMRATIAWLDALEPTPGARPTVDGATDDDPAIARARARLYRTFGGASEAIRVGTETIDRLTAMGRLATEPDPAARRTTFEALAPIWQAVDGDGGDASPYRRLLRSSAARWAVHGSPIEANAVALGLPAGSIEATLHGLLSTWRGVLGPDRFEPWDYRFAVGAAERRLAPLIPQARLLDVNQRYLASLGADPVALGIEYDVVPRPGRPPIPVAFTISMGAWAAGQPIAGPWNPRPPWVFATYAEGGLANLLELLHESGHAIHAAAIRTRPGFLEFPEVSSGFVEGIADVLGWDVDEPAWQARWLGEVAGPHEVLLSRYGAVMLDVCWALFEIEVHRHPARRPNDVWTEITADGLGIVPHPEWSWWATRGQLIDLPGYLANYALSAIVAASVRARILALRGPWFEGDRGWYRFIADGLFVPGASQQPATLLETFLGGPLTAEPLLADLRRPQ